MRLDKYLANCGVGTRTQVKKYILSGFIKVNNSIIKKADFKINELIDEIKFKDNEIKYEKFVYFMMNKPQGYLSANEDKYQKTVFDLIKKEDKIYDLFVSGRLDKNTEGMLLLTNDGDFCHRILSPKKHIKKVYYVELLNQISLDDKIKIENGVDIGGYITKKDAKIEIINNNSCYITISEGKFHQVKKMFNAVNNEVTYLKRIKMGNLKLDLNLKLGEYRKLTEKEVNLIEEKDDIYI